ncbi:hypothetical protein EV286_102148 [Rhizobium sp. BK251]|nr:hypothetical protein EV286_102148 [Rhizobium sp. BK251]
MNAIDGTGALAKERGGEKMRPSFIEASVTVIKANGGSRE